ncbi:hypothetical protein RvY_09762 [Ramazzottius varieornatus]|uniref:Uncharacterized protein n=1 Tax=Ramazzottius varieornatus TaxID=947166 RepID=A0A1D1VIA5_RAMVA|nr:hypothetical protein RvY_09762 [Ramazzottius varieornatus]
MSTTSKVTLGLAMAATTAIITYVHLSQRWDLEKIKAGVDRDIERQSYRKMVKSQRTNDEAMEEPKTTTTTTSNPRPAR